MLQSARRALRAAVHWVACWFLFPLGRNRRPARPDDPAPILLTHPLRQPPTCAFIYFHGNCGTATPAPWLNDAAQAAVYVPEYPGYGRHAAPHASEAGILAAADAAWARARADGWAPANIYLWGTSLGGAPAAHLAATRDCGGVVLSAAFASVGSVVSPRLASVLRVFGCDMFDNAAALARTRCRVAIVHATDDGLVARHNAAANYEAAANAAARNSWLHPGQHNTPPDEALTREIVCWVMQKE
jgi:fermentation-respiration switch protein FrsA (DUF1100 family)